MLNEAPTDDPRSDAELIVAINAGDTEAFSSLYLRYRDRVAKLAFRFTHHHDDALDVMQETFAYFIRKFPGFYLTSSLMTFFYPAVKNLALSARRKRLRHAGGEADAIDLPAPTASGDKTGLADVLKTLSNLHREVILMRFVDDMSLDEIARALDVPTGTIKSRLHHALRQLREDPRTREYFE